MQSLEEASKVFFKWFLDNLMKTNADNCYLSVSTSDKVNMRIDKFDICNSKCEKILGVEFDNKLTFDDHLSESCKKTSRKIHTLARMTLYMNILKRRILMTAFLHRNLVIALLYGCVAG